ncbi:MAG: cytidylate kinase-like family protein [Oscillospiraceae bacterium]|jgi:cytidylate kinase|nr:cytidylate kinase-like family protein [Oscillospiraceae bacterium]
MTNHIIITISRQYGSGGRLIGEKLAETLGIPFYDKELITLAAEQSGFSREIFERMDERASSSLLYTLSVNPGMAGGLTGIADLPLNDKVFLIQNNVIKQLADKGSCVIVGRCADYILKEYPNLIKVFICSDMTDRIERITKVYGVSFTNAEREVQKYDKRRSNYYSFYTHTKPGIAANYDLCLNSGQIGIDASVEVIRAYVEGRRRAAKK